MKLKAFNQENIPVIRTGKPTIRFFATAGLISISKAAALLMNLKEGSLIELCQNEDEPTDWYIHKTEEQSGFTLRGKTSSFCLTFNSTPLVVKVLSTLNIEKGASFLISKKPVIIDSEEYWYMITGNPMNVK